MKTSEQSVVARESHSPTPWKIENDDGDSIMRDADGKSLMGDTQYYPWTPAPDDWEFIVRACNAHTKLVEALNKLYDRNVEIGGNGRLCNLCKASAPLGEDLKHYHRCEAIWAEQALRLAQGGK